MAVYRRGYQRYQGPTPATGPVSGIAPFRMAAYFSAASDALLLLVAMIWPLLCGIFIYLTNHADLLKGIGKQFRDFIQVNGNFFLAFMSVQSGFSVLLAAITGPGLIAPDLANNALPLYFSRPLRTEYSRRLTTLSAAFIGHMDPGLAPIRNTGWDGGPVWFYANWRLGFGIIVGFAIWILLVSLVAMASSAYARMKAVAGGLVLGFFFLLSGLSAIVNSIFRVTWGNGLSPLWNCTRIWYALFNVDPKPGPGVPACSVVLLLIMLLLVLVIQRKLRPIEVVS